MLSKGDRTLSVIDPATLKILGKVPSGDDPHEVAASADGRTAYISNYGAGRGGFNTLTIGDIVNFKPLGTVDLGGLRGPHGMTEAGGKIYFTAEVAKAIGRVDPATNKVDWVLGTGRDITHMVVVLEGPAADLLGGRAVRDGQHHRAREGDGPGASRRRPTTTGRSRR